MDHATSPTGTAVLLLLALVIDYMSVGPDSLRDRIAFFIALPAIYTGFNGSPLDEWTVGWLGNLIQQGLNMADGAYIAAASATVLMSAAIGIYAIYTVGVLLPSKFSGRLGKFAELKWRISPAHRLNIELWIAAIVLGMLCDLPRGLVGGWLTSGVQGLASATAFLPNLLFGVTQ